MLHKKIQLSTLQNIRNNMNAVPSFYLGGDLPFLPAAVLPGYFQKKFNINRDEFI